MKKRRACVTSGKYVVFGRKNEIVLVTHNADSLLDLVFFSFSKRISKALLNCITRLKCVERMKDFYGTICICFNDGKEKRENIQQF